METDQARECFQQLVPQCHYTYITEYADGIREKCDQVFFKTCKIVFKEKAYNHTTRVCTRPMIKDCGQQELPSYGTYGSPQAAAPVGKLVCHNMFETVCNTTSQIPAQGEAALPFTFCENVPRKICAPETCRVVEGEEVCEEKLTEATIEQPEETCHMEPEQECRKVTTSVPQLIPQQMCREVPKEVCTTKFVNPRNIKEPVFVKYCTKDNVLTQSPIDNNIPNSPQISSTGPSGQFASTGFDNSINGRNQLNNQVQDINNQIQDNNQFQDNIGVRNNFNNQQNNLGGRNGRNLGFRQNRFFRNNINRFAARNGQNAKA